MKECPICSGEISKVETSLSLFNDKIKINPIIGFECTECNEIFIDEDESKRVDRLTNTPYYKNQIENIQKTQLRLRRKIGFSGRSLIVRIPKDIELNCQIRDGDEIDIYVEGKNKIIIEKLT